MTAELMLTRRSIVALIFAGLLGGVRPVAGQGAAVWPDWTCAPIGWAGQVPGVGFRIGHGFACENTWFASGWWHTGEDWYALDRDTAGASVFAVAAGEVVYADFSYPGRVVILQHAPDLYSMYGHLDPDSVPDAGAQVVAGDQIGTVFQQAEVKGPGQAPSHLHFEVRDFLIRDDVNGNAPQFGVNCGFQCPPGPGYWPQSAPTHPAELGWRNPTEEVWGRIEPVILAGLATIANVDLAVPLRPDMDASGTPLLDSVNAAQIVAVTDIVTGAADDTVTSALGYDAWMQVTLADGTSGWVQVAAPSSFETGSDGRPSSVDRPVFLTPVAD